MYQISWIYKKLDMPVTSMQYIPLLLFAKYPWANKFSCL